MAQFKGEQGSTAVQEKVTDMLRQDHRKVQDLFERFDEAATSGDKRDIARECCTELKIHTALEEEIFYPFVRQGEELSELVDQALEEHHVAKLLIDEIEQMGPEGARYDAKFKVLASAVKQHIHMEEFDIFPQAATLDVDQLAPRMTQRKEELREELSEVEEVGIGGGKR